MGPPSSCQRPVGMHDAGATLDPAVVPMNACQIVRHITRAKRFDGDSSDPDATL